MVSRTMKTFWFVIILMTSFGCNNLSEQSIWTYYRINESIVASTQRANNQSEGILAMLESGSIKDSLRFAKWIAVAVKVKHYTDSTVNVLREIQAAFIERGGGWLDSSNQIEDWNNGLGELAHANHTNATCEFFVKERQGNRILLSLQQYEDSVIIWLDDPFLTESLKRQLPLSKMLASDTLRENWSANRFNKLSSVEALILTNKCILDVRLSESILLEYYLSQAVPKYFHN